ncbi:hypothetical protein ANCCAN_23035 [Ancylostoma caninum]|uniref:Uncharacterized protein n=1 Tax=Ancylostoma caninum TaxID=29170 RepID=A0A368FGD0_ANCCA|nr:hypothetical protein ANCCAN_23035 [Ancylostoma caninum]
MAYSVDRSFCPSRCSERGVCFLVDGSYGCLCYDVDVAAEDCSTIFTTTAELNEEVDWTQFWSIWAAVILACIVLCGMVSLVVWHVRRRCRRVRLVVVSEDERGDARRCEAVPAAPPNDL